ncbi:MAG: tRNA pseudouridine(38-40) synthase TruA [Armatimonadetes bacterium]|nr:tRNA pseudouridine(38-40) synthase TruA [Armatimonadota bacterium]
MRKLKLTVQYDGTDFAGFQRQPDVPTVQRVLEEAIGRCLGHPVSLTAASRTDAGVHALGQVVAVETERPIPVEAAPVAFTAALPASVAVVEAEEVDPGFHPRFAAKWKQYVYRIVSRPVRSPILGRFAWCLPHELSVEMMAAAAEHIKGRYDFRSFCAGGAPVEDFVREVTRLDLSRDGDVIECRIEADGFLYRMVRNIVGTLVEVGRDRLAPEEVGTILAARDRTRAGPTAPPQGLCLVKVAY